MSPRRVPDGDTGRAAAIEALRGGGIVALPTDTVYGIAVALDARDGIPRLFAAKSRPPDRSIALLVADRVQAEALGELDTTARALADAFWPGGLTLVVPRREGLALPPELTSDARTVGLRVPDHAAPRALAAAVGPLPTTSANRSGEPEARDADAIEAVLGDAIELILDGGPAPGGPASTVVDCTGPRPRVLRVGAVALEAIEAVVGR
ncbi:MAG TPA: L-threonylcarbamoyladenylate synthase [Candidatus Polarisedimenticolia bacterium]|nr:L-threonylcarbamoyladenylate synthase [Candidatus Polarisedimenticolia bacterium]